MPKKNKSKYALLGMLTIQPMSGYEIKKMVERSISYFWSEDYAQIYPLLKEFVVDGLASVETRETEGKPDRHIYTLTDKGMAELCGWLNEAIEPAKFRSELLLKLFFGKHQQVENNIKHLELHHARMTETRQILEGVKSWLTTQAKAEPANLAWTYNLITVNFGLETTLAIISWCTQSLLILTELAREQGK